MANNTRRSPRVWRVETLLGVHTIVTVGWYRLFGRTVFYTRHNDATQTVAEFGAEPVAIIDQSAIVGEPGRDGPK